MSNIDDIKKALKRFGGEIRTGNTIAEVETIPTGIYDLDKNVLGVGGVPRGRIIELAGLPNAGKTSLAEHIIASVQKDNGTAVLFNLEGTYDPIWGERAGINNEELIIPETRWGEEVFDEILSLLGIADVIVLDSLARLRSKDILTRTMDDGKKVAANAGMNEMGFGHITSGTYNKKGTLLTPKLTDTKTVIIVINQVRSIIGAMYGPTLRTPGGYAAEHDYSIRLMLSNPKYEKDGEHHKQRIRVKCIKNKLAPPLRECEFYLTENNELVQDDASILLNQAIDVGMIEQRGAWYYSKHFPDGKFQGKAKFDEWLVDVKDEFIQLIKSYKKEESE